MTTLYNINLTCNVCGTEFGSSGIASCGYGSKRTDFRPNYWGFNPVEYFFHLCPKCGFCVSEHFFKKNNFSAEFKKDIKSMGPLKEYSLSKKLEKAAICSEVMNKHEIAKDDNYALANIWMHAYWWSDEQSEITKYGKIVLKYFEKAVENGEIPGDRYHENIYLMGEINRRIGEQEKAADLFDEVISDTQDNEKLKGLRDLALQQKLDPKDKL